jgi:basic amino acid/polyamine antiporter, APA family
LRLFDAIMLVMGGIVGAGIFANPSEVAHRVHTPFLILGVWVLGGFIAMCGAFIWAELATRLPGTGGQYLYLREAYHPSVAFVYGWGLLLVTQTGGMAAVAVIFASYFRGLTGLGWSDSALAAIVLLSLTAINCLGARVGSNVQSVLMLLKIVAIAALVVGGLTLGGGSLKSGPLLGEPVSFGLLKSIGGAMVPIAFAYGGWQTASFVAGEMRDARRDLSSARAWPSRPGCDSDARFQRDADRTGRTRRAVDRSWNCNFHPWNPQPKHAHDSARLLRNGARRSFL